MEKRTAPLNGMPETAGWLREKCVRVASMFRPIGRKKKGCRDCFETLHFVWEKTVNLRLEKRMGHYFVMYDRKKFAVDAMPAALSDMGGHGVDVCLNVGAAVPLYQVKAVGAHAQSAETKEDGKGRDRKHQTHGEGVR